MVLVLDESLSTLKQFARKAWLPFIIVTLIGMAVREVMRYREPTEYFYSFQVLNIPKSLLQETKEHLEKIAWEQSSFKINSKAHCLQVDVFFECRIDTTFADELEKNSVDEIKSTWMQEGPVIANQRFALVTRAQKFISLEELSELLIHDDGLEVWVYRKVKELMRNKNYSEMPKDCLLFNSLTTCLEFIKQETKSKNYAEFQEIANFVNILIIDRSLIEDVKRFQNSNSNLLNYSFEHSVKKYSYRDQSGIFRSFLFGLSISLLLHSFVLIVFVQRDGRK